MGSRRAPRHGGGLRLEALNDGEVQGAARRQALGDGMSGSWAYKLLYSRARGPSKRRGITEQYSLLQAHFMGNGTPQDQFHRCFPNALTTEHKLEKKRTEANEALTYHSPRRHHEGHHHR